MPAYEVEWKPGAREDLLLKASDAVCRELVEVSRTALEDRDPRYSGEVPPYYWRRGVTLRRRVQLDAAEAQGQTLDTPGDDPWDYVLVYKNRGSMRGGYVIVGVYKNSEMAGVLREWSPDDQLA